MEGGIRTHLETICREETFLMWIGAFCWLTCFNHSEHLLVAPAKFCDVLAMTFQENSEQVGHHMVGKSHPVHEVA